MAHEEQNDPVAQSSMYQRRPPNLVASTADLSERDIKENPVVKEEETNDTEVFEEVVVEVARLSKEPKSSISPPPGSSMPPPGSSTFFVLDGVDAIAIPHALRHTGVFELFWRKGKALDIAKNRVSPSVEIVPHLCFEVCYPQRHRRRRRHAATQAGRHQSGA